MSIRAKTTEIEPQQTARSVHPDDSLFRSHFDNLPSPAYIWKRSGEDFALLAYNRAAESLSFSKTAGLAGTTVGALQRDTTFVNLLADLDRSTSRGTVVKREVDHRYGATDTVRRLALTLVPVSRDVVVMHTEDVTVRDITQRVEIEREVIASSERERTRIGHDLHDGLAQLLIGAKLLLETLTDRLAAAGSHHSQDARQAVHLVTRAISQTSDLAQGLSPIRRGGRLSDALKHLAKQSELLLGIHCSVVSVELPLALDENAATHIYRIMQEGITNAVKHGRATAVEVACKRQKQQLQLTITDNGSGITELASDRGGMGTHIMRYRAHSIGGDLTIMPAPKGGTVVTCICPWPQAVRVKRPAT